MAKRNTKLNDEVYYTVRNDIISGKYPGGTFITETDLCQQFGVSRTPVREALIRLSNERVIQLLPNRGALVPHITLNDIIELYQLRITNDGMAAYLSAERQTPELVQALEASVQRECELLAKTPADAQAVSQEDFAFHALLVNGCGNQRLIDTINLVQNEMARIIRLAADQRATLDTLPVSIGYHKQIIAAFHENNCSKARKAIEDHWRDMQDGYIRRSLAGTLPFRL